MEGEAFLDVGHARGLAETALLVIGLVLSLAGVGVSIAAVAFRRPPRGTDDAGSAG